MGSHICPDCGDQVVAAPGVFHNCRVRARQQLEAAIETTRVRAEADDLLERLRNLAEACAREVALTGHHVGIRIYAPYGVNDPQPDPIVDVWHSALPVAR